jgi:site-specific DNA-methyltransferase (adenine-specific)
VKPYYASSGITIYHADCREALAGLRAESVDVILTDPPYGIRYQSRKRRQHPTLPSSIQGDDSLNALRDAMAFLDPLLKPDRHAYVFAAPMRIGEAALAVSDFWHLKNVLIWDKGNAGSMGDCLAGYSVNWEAILYASKGRRPLVGPRPRCIYRYDWQGSRDPVHPTVKPVAVMRWLLAKSSQAGELVLDPFMGSGVVLRAAAELGRKAIGIEIEERYCEVAVERIENFRKLKEKPPQNPQIPQNV